MNPAIHSKWPNTRPYLYAASARLTRCTVEMFAANIASPITGQVSVFPARK